MLSLITFHGTFNMRGLERKALEDELEEMKREKKMHVWKPFAGC